MVRRSLAAVTLYVSLFSIPSVALAYGGARDTTFGGSGVVTNSTAGVASAASALAFQADGNIVVAGAAGPTAASVVGLANGVLAVARFTPSGSLDASFGSGGIVTTTIGDRVGPGVSVLVQPDGRIVVAVKSVASGVEQLALATTAAEFSIASLVPAAS